MIGALVLLLAAAGVMTAVIVLGGSLPTATSAPAHTAKPGEPALIQVEGYRYADPTAAERQSLGDLGVFVQFLNEQAPGYVTAASTHWVEKSGAGSIQLTLLELSPEYTATRMDQIYAIEGILQMMSGSPLATPLLISGEEVGYATRDDANGGPIEYYAWCHDGVLSVAWARKGESKVLDFVTAYLATANNTAPGVSAPPGY